MNRLGRNKDRYAGERIDIQRVLQESLDWAQRFDWQIDRIPVHPRLELVAFRRPGGGGGPHVYLSAGIHGDEPAGPLTLVEMLRLNQWPASISWWLCPCLNPEGFDLNQRENAQGVDLNRDYREFKSRQVQAHIHWLNQQPDFDLTLLLHEDWESAGFYVYEINEDRRPSLAEIMVEAAAAVCPVDRASVIDGRRARQGIIRPPFQPEARPDWPEAFFLATQKSRLSYTLEAPSDFELTIRVKALQAAVSAALQTAATWPKR